MTARVLYISEKESTSPIPFNLISGPVPDCIDKKLSFMLAVDVSMMNKIQTQWKHSAAAEHKELHTQMFAAR